MWQCETGVRKDLFGSVVLSGGSALFPGMADRLQYEMKALAPEYTAGLVIAPPQKNSAWVGGSIMGSLSTFHQRCVQRRDYDEHGRAVIHRICN